MTAEEAMKIRHASSFADLDVGLKGLHKCIDEALEKQIPKKPYTDNENGIYEKDYCPACHRSLFPYDHHCKCGQAIDWSETE